MPEHTVIIFEKDGRYAAMAADKGPKAQTVVGRFDGRLTQKYFHQYTENYNDGIDLLEVNARISESRGWKRIYENRRRFG
ncbi:MAG TPA: hypothetical protein VMM38_01525 [Aridibacter sp.]|nr:hypothetical protein [Aridibacter sp.]